MMADKELYRACAVEVKRQIWQDNQALFGDEVSPLLKQYILEKEGALFSAELSVLHNFFSPSPKARRQGEVGWPPCRVSALGGGLVPEAVGAWPASSVRLGRLSSAGEKGCLKCHEGVDTVQQMSRAGP